MKTNVKRSLCFSACKLIAGILTLAGSSFPAMAQTSPYITGEYLWNIGLLQINAHEAYDLGITGAGEKIAVLDTGINYYHPELFTQIANGGYDFYNNQFEYFDSNGHGSLVSGIIAAKKDDYGVHGVAYNSKILPIKVTNDDGTLFSLDALKWGLFHAIEEEATVINYSSTYATGGARPLDQLAVEASVAFAYTALNGNIIVAPTGNAGAQNPIFPAILPYVKPSNHNTGVYSFDTSIQNVGAIDWSYSEGHILAVASSNQDGVISDFSNRCGVAANWCITAPGEGIISTFWYDTYIDLDGTSLSTAFVSGSIALIREMFPNLTSAQVVDLLLTTANKEGIYADTATYGQGFLDIGAAIQPQGTLNIVTTEGTSSGTTLQNSYLQTGGAFGDSLNSALNQQQTVINDDYGRSYTASFQSALRPRNIDYFENDKKLEYLNLSSAVETHQLGSGLSFTGYTAQDGAATPEGVWAYQAGNHILRYSKGEAVIHDHPGAQSVEALKLKLFDPAYNDMATNGDAVAWQYALTPQTSFNVEYRNGHSLYDDELEATAYSAALAYTAEGNMRLNMSYGFVSERESMLGTTGSGAFDIKGNTQTHYAGVNAHVPLRDDLALLGSFYMGQTFAAGSSDSLITDISGIRHQQAAMGIEKQNNVIEGDRITLAFEQPLRVTGGRLSVDAMDPQQAGGFVIDLKPEAQERNFHLFYDTPVHNGGGHLGLQLSYTENAGHVDNQSAGNLLLHYKTSF